MIYSLRLSNGVDQVVKKNAQFLEQLRLQQVPGFPVSLQAFVIFRS